MKYKCIKSFPKWEEGDIYDEEFTDNINFLAKNYPEFFEPVQETKKSVYNLKNGELYYFITMSGTIDYHEYENDIWDNNHIKQGNAFLTREEAEKERDRREALSSIKRWIFEKGYEFVPDWGDDEEMKYSVCRSFGEFCVGDHVSTKESIVIPYFSQDFHAEELIKEKEKELKILFNVE